MSKRNKDLYYCELTPFKRAYVGLCLSDRAFHEELRRTKLKEDLGSFLKDGAVATTWTFNHRGGRTLYLVTLQEKPEFSMLQIGGLLAHAGTHVWEGEREALHETNPGSEVEAYGIQGLTQNLLEAFIRLRPKYKMVAKPVAQWKS